MSLTNCILRVKAPKKSRFLSPNRDCRMLLLSVESRKPEICRGSCHWERLAVGGLTGVIKTSPGRESTPPTTRAKLNMKVWILGSSSGVGGGLWWWWWRGGSSLEELFLQVKTWEEETVLAEPRGFDVFLYLTWIYHFLFCCPQSPHSQHILHEGLVAQASESTCDVSLGFTVYLSSLSECAGAVCSEPQFKHWWFRVISHLWGVATSE